MRHATSKKIYQYWENLRRGRPAPDRREIEPSDIRDLLGDTFILEIDPVYRSVSFRLAGTRLCSAYGRELKGLGFLALWDEQDNLRVMEAVRDVYETMCPTTMIGISKTREKRFVEYEIMLLPLLNSTGTTQRILGTASPRETAYWLGADPILSNRLKSVRAHEPEPATLSTPSLVPDLEMFRQEDEHGANSPRRVHHLRVFDGGKPAKGE